MLAAGRDTPALERGSTLKAEATGILLLAIAVLLSLSIISYDPADPSVNNPHAFDAVRNLAGLFGSYLADLLVQGLGASAYFFPLCFFVASYRSFLRKPLNLSPLCLLGLGLTIVSLACLLSLLLDSSTPAPAGGVLGGFARRVLLDSFNMVGALVLVLALMSISILGVSGASLGPLMTRLLSWPKWPKAKWGRRRAKVVVKREPSQQAVRIVEQPEPAQRKPVSVPEVKILPAAHPGEYTFPSVELLDLSPPRKVHLDREALAQCSQTLEHKLNDFGVMGEITAVRPGPVITMYEFKPAPGVKVRQIVPLADDLSMALKAMSVRILAPIPGEAVVGVEVPNPVRMRVGLREILETDSYQRSDSLLSLALGVEVFGDPLVADLARMPHLLVAGATGTGKSVSINAMILSILFRASPEDVRFIMIDPKMLELSVYEEIPHLLVPVVTEPKKAAQALNWAVEEMERRYRWMKNVGVRNIDGYNRVRRNTPARDEEQDLFAVTQAARPPDHLPKIVIVIDELADLMLSVRGEIEESITRLAQKARAAGIHLILATQRPSVDVITGLIKANFPARISFQVASRVDSRTILDSMGAERLLGDGDMLFLPAGTSKLIRVHGPYVSEGEIQRIVEQWRSQGKPQIQKEILEEKPSPGSQTASAGDPDDEMYDLAVRTVTETRIASISMLQRRLKLGFNRAARLIEQMEREGVVGPSEAGKPREVLVQKIE